MLLEAKSNLARLMATENLVIEERNVPTAYFDIKNRILTVPILNGKLSNYLYDLLLGHEVGHALETPEVGWHDSVTDINVDKSILNVCEDARIEKKIKRKFPGLKPSFVRGYQELLEMDFFGTKGINLNELNFIDRVNMYTKGGSGQGITFDADELPLLKEVESTETWEEVIAVARKIQEFMKSRPEKREQMMTQKVLIDSDDENTDDGGEAKDGDYQEMDFEYDPDGKPQGREDDLKEDAKEKADESPEDTTGNAGSKNESKSQPESRTDKSFREREKELYENNAKKDCIYTEIPDLNLNKIIVPYDVILNEIYQYNVEGYKKELFRPDVLKANFLKFKNDSNNVVSYLVKEFELRKNAEQQSRAKISKTGELNMNKVFEYKLTDDIFARMTTVPNGKSHGLVMFIDWSGSMHEHIHSTIKQLLNLVMFCKKVNIPFEVYAFTTQWTMRDQNAQKEKIGDLVVDKFCLLNILSSKMSPKEYVNMSSFLLDYGTGYRSLTTNFAVPNCLSLGGTPLNASIVAAFNIIPEFKKNNKLQVVNSVFLTDGDSGILSSRFSYVDVRTNKMICSPEVRTTNTRRVFFRDPKTKAVVEVQRSYGYGSESAQQTKALLTLLKERAQCNLMGFFIADSRSIRSAIEVYSNNDHRDIYQKRSEIDAKMVQFKKEKTYIIEDFGYDEYYMIRSNTLDTDDDELTVNSNTTRGLVSAFSKYTEGKVSSRIILNRFIKLIA